MDIATVIRAIALLAALFAAWQAFEARKSRIEAAEAQRDATESAEKAAHSAEIAANAQEKIAQAQESLSVIEQNREAANRRNVLLKHIRNSAYAIVNETGYSITDVEIRTANSSTTRIMRADKADLLNHGDSHRVLVRRGDAYDIHWKDDRGESQQRRVIAEL
ncbi:hypothetical protein [Corynebacterium ulcerans]|uniref:Secreted protein n=1 Tax=Corynebacterium ulcerans FRC58 TaxID=1408268 RepID=A0ABM5TYE0_CORUL|nr:hypothetical protein [Corynebacterium ulcerans]AKN76150.1 Hypothetical protein CulFRC58_0296 [Corynebacterium ulcerans FRC58]